MIALLVLACKPDPNLGPPSPASWVDDSGAVGAELVGASGNREAVVRVRAFNAFGGSVFSEPAQVDVDGVRSDVTIGAQGYGEVVIDEPGTHELEVGTSSATAWVYGTDWPGFGMFRGFEAPIDTDLDAINAGIGILHAERDAVWWTGTDLPSHRVLQTDGAIGGMVSGHYDGDGVLDAAVWSGRTIHFLRGRSGGGMTYAGMLRSPSHTVAGVDFGDATNDGVPDLVIAWVGGPLSGLLDVWESDGLLGYSPSPNRQISEIPFDVAVGDNTGEGASQITLTVDGGQWDRYFKAPIGYAPCGPSLELDLTQFTRVYSPGDFNRDGTDDLVFVPPFTPGGERRVVMFDLDGDIATFIGINRTDSYVVLDDVDGDGLWDMLFSEGNGDVIGVHAADDGGLVTTALAQGLAGGPIARVPDTGRVLVAGEEDWLWLDGRVPADGWYSTEDPALVTPGLTVRDGLFELLEIDGDPTAPELFAMRIGPGSSEVRLWTLRPSGIDVVGQVQLDPEEKELRDLAVCGTDAFVLLEDRLYRVDMSDPTAPSVARSVAMDARKLACGAGPAGPVSVLTDNSVLLLDGSLVQVGTSPGAGVIDLFLDASGTSTCDRPGCGVVRGPVGPDGQVVEVVGWPEGAQIDGDDVFGRGLPTIADVDGNGFSDVLFHDRGRIVLYRHTGDTLGPAEIFHTRRPFVGALAIADWDQDGFNDAWGLEPENLRLRITASGTMPFPPPVPTDTGDTGLPVDTDAPSTATTGDTGVN
ncbi:MAG: VCBS repeat-containing protein [Myxococcota bacterium]